jgi:signal transduction histidine kinase
LEERDGRVSVSIIDDGKGVSEDLEALRPGSYGIGIIGIKQRVQDHGGQFVLRSTNPGTVVEVSIPSRNSRTQPISAHSSNG